MLLELLNTPLFLIPLVIGVISGLVVILYYWRAMLESAPGPAEIIFVFLGGALGGGTVASIYEVTYTDEYITQAGPHYDEYVTKVEDNHSERIKVIEEKFDMRIKEIKDDLNEYIAGTRQELKASDEKLIRMRDGLTECLEAHDRDSGVYLRKKICELGNKLAKQISGNGAKVEDCTQISKDNGGASTSQTGKEETFEECIRAL